MPNPASHDPDTTDRLDLRWIAAARRQARATTVSRPQGGDALRHYRAIALGVALTDGACVFIALVSSYLLRYPDRPVSTGELIVILTAPLLWIAVFSAFDLYDPRRVSG